MWQANYDVDEMEEEEAEGHFAHSQTDGLLFLIDCNRGLFDANDSGETYFSLLMRCAKSVQRSKIFGNDKDLFGVVLFRTNKTTQAELKNVYVLQDLAMPDANRILELEKLENYSMEKFDKEFGFSASFSLNDAFWSCQHLFQKSKVNLGYKRIILFTNDDNPNHSNAHLQRQAITKTNDLKENDIFIELIPIFKSDRTPFDVNLFYKDCLPEIDQLPDTAQRFEELLTIVTYKDHKKRPQARIPLMLSDSVSLCVGVYNLVRRCTVPSPINLHKDTNEEIKTRSRYYLKSTGERLLPQDLKKSIEFAGRKVTFEKEELNMIRGGFCPVGFKVLGFKPLRCLKRHHYVRPCQFLYPDEKSIGGSTVLFTALLARCLDRKQFPLCCYVPRQNSPPVYVALMPQEEQVDENNTQLMPPGFHVIFLPNAEDFRSIELPKTETASREQIDCAKKLVQALQLTFDPERVNNPQVQRHYANLEALALDREAPEEVLDLTMPNVLRMNKKAGKEIEEFKAIANCVEVGKKRPAGSQDKGPESKKSIKDFNVEKMVSNGQLETLTVPLLKEAIKSLGIRCTASRKADLVAAINKHFE